jgi:hypothetical protein
MLAEYYQQAGDRLFPMKKNAIAFIKDNPAN